MALTVYGMFIPRIVIVFLYLFSGWFAGVFANGWWLLVGTLFLPCTTLWYSAVFNWYGGTWDAWQTSIFVGAFIVDVSLLVRGRSA